MNSRRLGVIHLGRQSYTESLALQRELREALLDGKLDHDLLLLVEHNPVYTMGRGTRATSLPETHSTLRARGADVVEIERGGDVTWHGPGQLVGYPILDLTQHRTDLHWYLRALEEVLINSLAELDITGATVQGKTGVWVDNRKIASLGIHVRRWVTLHGFALNVQPDLAWFDAIVPCGIAGVQMTSIAVESTRDDLTLSKRWELAQSAVIRCMGATFDLEPVQEELPDWSQAVKIPHEPCDSASERPTFIHYG